GAAGGVPLVKAALWLLIGLQLRGWVRYFGRSLFTVKGALLALVGVLVFIPWLASVVLMPHAGGFPSEQIRRYGPAFLLLYCLMTVRGPSGGRALSSTPAEINFLFPGPFSRRQLLAYKILSSFVIALPSTVILAAMLQMHASWFVAAYVGLVLM